jgi:hypothetical protein
MVSIDEPVAAALIRENMLAFELRLAGRDAAAEMIRPGSGYHPYPTTPALRSVFDRYRCVQLL